MDEADQDPACDQRGLPRDHAFQKRVIGAFGSSGLRIMARDDVIGEPPHAVGIATRREILERSDPDVACGDAGENGAGQRRFAHHAFAGDHGSKRARGRNAERCHRFADDIFAQHRTECRAAIAAARKRGRTRTLELNVAADAVGVDHLAKQNGAAVAELWHEMTELVAGIGHRDRLRAIRQPLAGEDFGPFRTVEPIRIEPEMDRQRPVQFDQPRRDDRGRRHPGEEVRRQCRIGILEGEMHGHGDKIGISGR